MTDSESDVSQNDKSVLTPEWLTSDIFEDILRENVNNFEEIQSFSVSPAVATGENFMTVLLQTLIKIKLKDGTIEQKSFMVKVVPDIEKMQEMLKDWKVFEKELSTYSNYIPEFVAMFKKAGKEVQFGARIFKTSNSKVPKDVIIMEDLRSRGFKNIKRQEGLDMDHTKSALEKLAQFHAASACFFESKGSYPIIYDRCLCSTKDLFQDYRKVIVNLLIECLPSYGAGYLAERLKTYTALAPDQFQAKSQLHPDEFNVLNHGDCWSNNIMFQYNADGSIANTCFIDWQMSRYGSPAHDLSYLLITSTSLENKVKHFDYFVAYYHDKLTENLRILKYPKKLPTLKELHISLLRHGDWAYTVITTVMPVLLLDPTEKANMDNVIDDGEKGDELKKIMFTNSRFIAHMKQLLPWMDNRGLLSYSA